MCVCVCLLRMVSEPFTGTKLITKESEEGSRRHSGGKTFPGKVCTKKPAEKSVEVLWGDLDHWYLLDLSLPVTQQLVGSLVGLVDEGSDLAVDETSCGFTVRFLQNHLTLTGQVEGNLTHLSIHPKLHNLQQNTKTRGSDRNLNLSCTVWVFIWICFMFNFWELNNNCWSFSLSVLLQIIFWLTDLLFDWSTEEIIKSQFLTVSKLRIGSGWALDLGWWKRGNSDLWPVRKHSGWPSGGHPELRW